MNKVLLFNTLVKIASTVMFIYQINYSVTKLLNPPLADVSQIIPVTNLDPLPMITICPFNQINESKVKEIGYRKTSYFLKGVKEVDGEQQISWGSDLNKTFDAVLESVLYASAGNSLTLHVKQYKDGFIFDDKYNDNLMKKFYIGTWGYCWQLEEYDITSSLEFYFTPNKDFIIYVTDRNMKTHFGVQTNSLVGQRILTNSANRMWFEIGIHKSSHYEPNNPDSCIDYRNNMFENCVDEKVESGLQLDFDCNVPWLSAKNHCTQVVKTKYDIDTYMSKLNSFIYHEDIPFTSLCPQPCNSTIFTARLRETYPKDPFHIKISFTKEVYFTKKLMTYNFSSFLVDIGMYCRKFYVKGFHSYR